MEKSKSLVILPDHIREQLAAIESSGKTAIDVFNESEDRLIKALDAGEALLAKADKGVTPELDQELNRYLVKCRKTAEYFKDLRGPYTKILDEIKAAFRSLERPLEKGQGDGIYDKIQKIRNDYAAKLEADRLKADEEARRQRLTDEEAARVREQLANSLRRYVSGIIQTVKSAINNLLESATLENIDAVESMINEEPAVINPEHIAKYQAAEIQISYITEEVYKNIRTGVKNELYGVLADGYKREIAEYKLVTIGKIPAKREELEAIAAADKAEAERLEKEAADRVKAEEEKLAADKQAADDLAAKKESDQKAADVVAASFNTAEPSAEPEASPEVRKEYEINVLGLAGWSLIVAFWLKSEEAKKLPAEKFPGKTLRSMKTYAERLYKKTGEKIESEYIQYIPKVKAIAKADKPAKVTT